MPTIYSSSSLANPQVVNGNFPSGCLGVLITNSSTWYFTFTSDTGAVTIPPLCTATLPVTASGTWTVTPGANSASVEPSNILVYVELAYLFVSVAPAISSLFVVNQVLTANLAPGATVQAQVTNTTLDVTGSTVTANLPAGTAVDANIAGSVTLDSNSTVVNDYLTMNPSFKATTQTMPLTTVAAGASVGFTLNVPEGFYDAAQLYMDIGSSANGLDGVVFQLDQIRYQTTGLATWISVNGPTSNFSFPYYYDNANIQALSALLPFGVETNCNMIYILMTNNNTGSISIEYIFTLYLRYASQNIVNPTSAPVYQQGAVGGFNDFEGISASVSTGNQALFSSISGGYTLKVQGSIQNPNTVPVLCGFFIESSPPLYYYYVAPAASSSTVPGVVTVDVSFGTGVVNSGIASTMPTTPASALQYDFTVIYTQTLGQSIPATLI
ncbi:MAG: hypothetical protein ACYCT2_09005 [Thermoplasmataceae archaeon]